MDSLDSVITKVDDKTKVEEWIFKTDIATEDIEDSGMAAATVQNSRTPRTDLHDFKVANTDLHD